MRTELIERATNGDREAFGQLAAHVVDRLNGIARLVVGDPDLADDAVQEALVRCWRELPKLRDVERFDGWLYRILIRAATDELRRRRRFDGRIQVLKQEPTMVDGATDLADRDELEQGFRRLSVDHRVVLVLHHYVGLPLPDVAKALGIPAGTAKSRYHYGMAALRAALEAERRTIAQGNVPA